MASRRKPRDPSAVPGRYQGLTPARHDALVTAVGSGCPMEIAAGVVGVTRNTLHRWLREGRNETEARLNPQYEADRSKDPLVNLWIDVEGARDKAAAKNVLHIQKAAAGGSVVEETKRTYVDADGKTVTETTVKRTAPDWRAAAWWLERRERRVFGKEAVQIEVSGPGGGPMEVASVNLDALEARFAANLAASLAEGTISTSKALEHRQPDGTYNVSQHGDDDAQIYEAEVVDPPNGGLADGPQGR